MDRDAYIGAIVGVLCRGDTARVITDAFQVGDAAVPTGSFATWLRVEADGGRGLVYGAIPADQDEANPTVKLR